MGLSSTCHTEDKDHIGDCFQAVVVATVGRNIDDIDLMFSAHVVEFYSLAQIPAVGPAPAHAIPCRRIHLVAAIAVVQCRKNFGNFTFGHLCRLSLWLIVWHTFPLKWILILLNDRVVGLSNNQLSMHRLSS